MTATNASPERLYLLQLSNASVPLPNGGTLEMVSTAYLVEMSDGSYILIDSGVPADYTSPAMPVQGEVKNVLAHIAELGLTPAAIGTVIATHFDVDHVGFHDAFPQAEFVVQRHHYEVAHSG